MKKIINNVLSKLKFKIETSHFPNDDIDLDNLCQFIDSDELVDIELYKESGIVVVRNVFKQSKIDKWRNLSVDQVKITKFEKKHNGKKYWISSVDKINFGQEIVKDKKLLSILNQIIDDRMVFVGHDSLSIDYSVPGLHDDQKSYQELYGDEVKDTNSVRVLFNLNASESKPQRFGFVRGSHLRKEHKIDRVYCQKNIVWVDVSHGTVIFFDPRIIHSADALNQRKVMCVLTYDEDCHQSNEIYYHTYNKRGQGVGPSSEFWNLIEDSGLKPSFINGN